LDKEIETDHLSIFTLDASLRKGEYSSSNPGATAYEKLHSFSVSYYDPISLRSTPLHLVAGRNGWVSSYFAESTFALAAR
jgi:hypothetical protein